MKCNIGKKDRSIRIVLGTIILGLGLYYENWLGLIGLVPIVTALIGWCPAYFLLNLNTCPKCESNSETESN